jgi:putative membrane protein
MYLILALLVNAVAFIITSYLLGAVGVGFHIMNFETAVIAAIVLGVVNTFIKPILAFLTLPLSIITLGLFTFVLNAIMLFIVSYFVKGLVIDGWIPAILGAIVLSVVSTALSTLVKDVAKK